MESIAAWILERGGSLFSLEQLLGSLTIFGTVKTQYLLRAFNVLALVLLLLWSLSPLGAQATLRVLSTDYFPYNTSQTIFFVNTSALGVRSTFGLENLDLVPAINAIYSAALISSATTQASMDPWGNVKIPMLERLDQSASDADGWIPVPTENISYSALLGVPIARIPTGNSSFQVISSYFYLDCQHPNLFPPNGSEYVWPVLSEVPQQCIDRNESVIVGSNRYVDNVTESTFSIGGLTNNAQRGYSNYYVINPGVVDWTGGFATSPREILFQSVNKAGRDGVTAVNCTIQFSTVQSQIFCVNNNCTVTKMRPFSSPFPPTHTPLEDCVTAKNFYNQFSLVFSNPLMNLLYSSYTELYVEIDESPLANSTAGFPMWELTGLQIGDRLGRAMNTYWLASLIPEYIAGGMPTFNFTYNEWVEYFGMQAFNVSSFVWSTGPRWVFYPGNTTDAFVSTLEYRYVCDKGWLAILIISSGVLLVVGGIGTALKYAKIGPDILGYFSSLTRDNPNVAEGMGHTTLDGFERARMLKGLTVKLGDVQPDKNFGRISIATSNGPRPDAVAGLRRGRVYL